MTILDFTSPSIAYRKADADQIYLLDLFVDGHELMDRASKLVADDVVKSTPQLRALVGNAADWMRLFEQTIEQLEQEIKDAAA